MTALKDHKLNIHSGKWRALVASLLPLALVIGFLATMTSGSAAVDEHPIFIPSITRPDWVRFDQAASQNVRAIAACPHHTTNEYDLYLGTDTGLFHWEVQEWKQIENVPGSVREIIFGANCQEIFAAVLGDGVWGTKDAEDWSRIGQDVAALKTSRTVIVRDNTLFTGTDSGVYYYNLGSTGSVPWTPVTALEGKMIARLTLAENRIFAGVWEKGVAYNDSCVQPTCAWPIIDGPNNDKFVREVIGEPPMNEQNPEPPTWMLFATASGVYWWDGENEEWQPPSSPPQPAGDVFTLAQRKSEIFAGLESGGVWVTVDDGKTWSQVGGLNATVRDIALTTVGQLLAATFDQGVWR